jgi:hypothetical protein
VSASSGLHTLANDGTRSPSDRPWRAFDVPFEPIERFGEPLVPPTRLREKIDRQPA